MTTTDKPKLAPGLYWRGDVIWMKYNCKHKCKHKCSEHACKGIHCESCNTDISRRALDLRNERKVAPARATS